MNKKLIIDYKNGVFTVEVIEYDSLPFGNNPEETVDKFTANDEVDLNYHLLKENIYDKLKDNE